MIAPASAQLLLAGQENHMDWGAGGWVLMGLGMVIFWGLVIFGVVWLVRTLAGHDHHPAAQQAPSALEILDRNLAEGTISVDEYHERRGLLTRPGQ